MRFDFFGQELSVGDTVIFGTTVNSGRGFEYGTIEKFSPKMVSIKHFDKMDNRYRKSTGDWERCPKKSSVYADALCKVDPSLVSLKILKGKP